MILYAAQMYTHNYGILYSLCFCFFFFFFLVCLAKDEEECHIWLVIFTVS